MPLLIGGVLHLQLFANGTVAFIFTPGENYGLGSSPLIAKSAETAQEDLVHSWGFTPNKARVTIDELKLSGHAERDADVDASMVAKLFPS